MNIQYDPPRPEHLASIWNTHPLRPTTPTMDELVEPPFSKAHARIMCTGKTDEELHMLAMHSRTECRVYMVRMGFELQRALDARYISEDNTLYRAFQEFEVAFETMDAAALGSLNK